MDQSKQKPLHAIKLWISSHKRSVIFLIVFFVLFGAGIATYILTYLPAQEALQQEAIKKAAPKKFYSPLTGLEVPSKKATERQVTAIMLENSPEARPQSGIRSAGVVYEAIAEGGITRFLALYQESRPNLIGPVRSVRPYYVKWAAAYDASMAHIGGSSQALQLIRSGNYGHDIDQFFNPSAYYRSTDRYAPHNVYTTFKRLDALNKLKGYTKSKFTGFARKSDQPKITKNATKIAITISSDAYNVNYTYNSKNRKYTRFQGGEPHKDREAGQITPKVVAVIKVPTTIGLEDGYREQMKVTGSGQAYVFQDGRILKATWQKASVKSPLVFKNRSGKIKLNRGQTWITAIPTDRSVTWR